MKKNNTRWLLIKDDKIVKEFHNEKILHIFIKEFDITDYEIVKVEEQPVSI